MGIDIYAKWEKQTKEEEKAQFTGFSITDGHNGYLREAYHGGPYATKYLVKEAFESEEYGIKIPAKVLRERLEETLKTIDVRMALVYGETDKKEIAIIKKSFVDFVELCERKERETGEPCTIEASY